MNVNFLPGIESSASALNAERLRMEVIGQNVANASSMRGPDGKPFQRHQVVFESVLSERTGSGLPHGPALVRVARIEADTRPPRMVYNPFHPLADSQGFVASPDINIHQEMADMIASSRAFEANLAVVKNSRQMALQTLQIGKR